MNEQALHEQLEQKTAQLAAVREISQAIAQAEDLAATLDLITKRTAELMTVNSCSIYLYDPQKEALMLEASTGLNQQSIGQMSLPWGMGLTGWAAKHSELVAVADAKADPRFYHVIGSGESRFASLMAMPLITSGKVIGAANVQTTENHTFTEDEIELFGFISELAATALEKAKMVHAAVVQEIHHRVKNNLQTIAMLLRLQVAQADHLTPQDILHETINRVLSIASVHEMLAQDHHAKVSLNQLVKQVAKLIEVNMTINRQVRISVEGDDLHLPSQLATNLALITNELLQNAIQHSFSQKLQGHISIQIAQVKNQLTLTVTDNGQGLPHTFDLEIDRGLGLDLVYTMVTEDLAGTFTLKPISGNGTQAIVCVPVASLEDLELDATYRFA